ncbi:uncharacterized protein LOC134398177 [Elgaria multicarinata webbii]|uniref:uncharacterized protein LOC134398177 n=1 Tax=Elgaria multicarinata webbii TaxID=159646 RepID=UPI002FCD2C5C
MAASFQLYKKSTLPPLLDSYLPVNCRNQNGLNQQKREADHKGRTRKNNTLSEEEKEKLIQQALQEQRHLETYKNLYKLRNILCKRYSTLLNEKVQKQRIQIKMSDLRLQQQLKPKAKKDTALHKKILIWINPISFSLFLPTPFPFMSKSGCAQIGVNGCVYEEIALYSGVFQRGLSLTLGFTPFTYSPMSPNECLARYHFG